MGDSLELVIEEQQARAAAAEAEKRRRQRQEEQKAREEKEAEEDALRRAAAAQLEHELSNLQESASAPSITPQDSLEEAASVDLDEYRDLEADRELRAMKMEIAATEREMAILNAGPDAENIKDALAADLGKLDDAEPNEEQSFDSAKAVKDAQAHRDYQKLQAQLQEGEMELTLIRAKTDAEEMARKARTDKETLDTEKWAEERRLKLDKEEAERAVQAAEKAWSDEQEKMELSNLKKKLASGGTPRVVSVLLTDDNPGLELRCLTSEEAFLVAGGSPAFTYVHKVSGEAKAQGIQELDIVIVVGSTSCYGTDYTNVERVTDLIQKAEKPVEVRLCRGASPLALSSSDRGKGCCNAGCTIS